MSARWSAAKLALLGKQLWETQGPLRSAEPVAIIGMACRFPGGVDSPEALWDLLLAGRVAVGEVPPDRWDVDALFDPDPAAPGRVSTRWAAWLEDVRGFDATFFGIGPAEAQRIDPQHRIALEVACDALDDAGIPFESLRDSATGVYFSAYHNDYAYLQYDDPDSVTGRTLTGTLHSLLANRISYVLGLRGPSMIVDTACSSSLVALHLACQALRARECDLALVGGVNLILAPDVTIALSKGGFMSPGGRCRVFDAGADGFVRGEGCAAVVVKRLADAIADSDAILAVVRGSAVNQDGESTTITAPSGVAQEALVREALRRAGIDPSEVSLLEAHGTGTALGDPIETDALAAVFGGRAPELGPCHLGSIKANLGHAEAVAGLAGVIKVVLCMRHGLVPPQPNLTSLNPHISLDGTPFRIAREPAPWSPPAGKRVAGVSSFGVGGTNAHVVLEEAPAGVALAEPQTAPPYLLPISARSDAALVELREAYATLLRRQPDSAAAICRAAARRRSHHRPFRVAVVGDTAEELAAEIVTRAVEPCPERAPELCFVYTGQGSQYAGMAIDLLERDAGFRAAFERIDRACVAAGATSPLKEIARRGQENRLDRTDVAQVALFAVQAALTDWLAARGIRPTWVVGHSAGEAAAALAAGLLALEEAAALVVARGRAMQSAYDSGRMLAVRAAESRVHEVLAGSGAATSVSVAAVNGPNATVISGATGDIETAARVLADHGLDAIPLNVRFAFHSPLMEEAARALMATCPELGSGRHRVDAPAVAAMISTVTGDVLDRIDADYAARNVRSPVRFADAVRRALALGARHFVEIGPHPALMGSVLETAAEEGHPARATPTLRRGHEAAASLFEAVGALYEWGVDPDWRAVWPGVAPPFPLPAYPWQHREYWLPSSRPRPDAAASAETRRDPVVAAATERPAPSDFESNARRDEAPFPGRRVTSPALSRPVFEVGLSHPALTAFDDHRIDGAVRWPGTAIAELVRCAAREAGLGGAVRDIAFLRAVEPRTAGRVQVVFGEPSVTGVGNGAMGSTTAGSPAGRVPVEVYTGGDDGNWTLVATAAVDMAGSAHPPGANHGAWTLSSSPAVDDLQGASNANRGNAQRENDPPAHDAAARLYRIMSDRGVSMGPGFRLLDEVRATRDRASGRLDPRRAAAWGGGVHPAVVDACAQLCVAVLDTRGALDSGSIFLPWALDTYHVLTDGEPAAGRVALRELDRDTATFDVAVLDSAGVELARLDGWRLRRARFLPAPLRATTWRTEAAAPPTTARGNWLVVAESGELGPAVARALEAAGQRATLAEARDVDIARVKCDGVIFLATGASTRVAPAGPIEAPRPSESTAAHALLTLARTLAAGAGTARRLLVVTRGTQPTGAGAVSSSPGDGGAWGLARSIRSELPELRCTSLDLDLAPGERALPEAEAAAIVAEALSSRVDAEVALRMGERRVADTGAASLSALPTTRPGPVVLSHEAPGTLDGFALRAAPAPPDPAPGTVRVRVIAAGVNFKDVLFALGEAAGGGVFGQEAYGEVTAVRPGVTRFRPGDRVLVFHPGCFSTYVTVPESRVFAAPRGLPPAACATIPVAFATAWHALHDVGRLEPGQRVLIHAGAGGVGQAAIQLALRAGAEVYATAGSPAKRALLVSLGVAGAFDSRSVSFADEVLAETNGAGVDLVLNSLVGPLIQAGLRCLRPGGIFVELGKRDSLELEPGMVRGPRGEVRYVAFDLYERAAVDPELLPRIVGELTPLLESGELRPLPACVLRLEEAGAALRRIARAEHVGKLVLTVPPPVAPVSDSGWAVVTGGTGAVGLATARWLAASGAPRIALLARHRPDERAEALLDALRSLGAEVRSYEVDVADEAALARVLHELRASGWPITRVIHAAGEVDDGTLANLTWDRAQRVIRGKVDGAWNLHRLTRDDPVGAFVLCSALGPVIDGAGLGAYATANAALDALAVWRRGLGLPAASVQWGPWSGGGMAGSLDPRQQARWTRAGLDWWEPDVAPAMLEPLLTGASVPPVVVAAKVPEQAADGAGAGDVGLVVGRTTSPGASGAFARSAPGAHRAAVDSRNGTASARTSGTLASAGTRTTSLADELAALPPHRRRPALDEHVRACVATILGESAIDGDRPLRDLGLDSLSAIELRNSLTVSIGQPLPPTLAFDHPTANAIAAFLARRLELEPLPPDRSAAGTAQPIAGLESESGFDQPRRPDTGPGGALRLESRDEYAPDTYDEVGPGAADAEDRMELAGYVAMSEAEAEELLLREIQELESLRAVDPRVEATP